MKVNYLKFHTAHAWQNRGLQHRRVQPGRVGGRRVEPNSDLGSAVRPGLHLPPRANTPKAGPATVANACGAAGLEATGTFLCSVVSIDMSAPSLLGTGGVKRPP